MVWSYDASRAVRRSAAHHRSNRRCSYSHTTAGEREGGVRCTHAPCCNQCGGRRGICVFYLFGLHQGCIPFGSLLCYMCVLEWHVSQLYESRIFRASISDVRSNQWQSMLNLISV